jgi:hypothetical protein
MKTKKTSVILVLIFFSLFINTIIHTKPINANDKNITILYICNLNGNFHFDEEGRKGLATIAEIKRRELEKNYSEKGGVLLLSQGLLFNDRGEDFSFSILKTALFDSVFLSERELAYMEKNPNLVKLDLPILANRDTYLEIETEKIFSIEGIKVRVNNFTLSKIPHDKKELPNLNLVFPENGRELNTELINSPFPIFYFLPKEKTSSFAYKDNVYTAECPETGDKLGRLKLTFRNGDMIRQYQDFIFLNSKDSNGSWIKPHKETMKELQKN